MTEKILVLDQYRGVKVGGRFDGWLMRRGGDGQWVTVRKLPEEGPYDHAPDDVREMFGLEPSVASPAQSPKPSAIGLSRCWARAPKTNFPIYSPAPMQSRAHGRRGAGNLRCQGIKRKAKPTTELGAVAVLIDFIEAECAKRAAEGKMKALPVREAA